MPLINNLENQDGGGLEANQALPVDWVQFVGRSTPAPTMVALAWGSSQAVITIDINFGDLVTAIPSLLGTAVRSFALGAGASNILRTLPFRHPYLTHMVCTRISNGQPLLFSGKQQAQNDPILIIPPTATFKYFRLTCVFTPPHYNLIDDTTLQQKFGGDESMRYTEWKRVHTSHVLARKAPDFKWGDGPAMGKELTQNVAQYLSKPQLIATWRMVPEDSLFPFGPLGTSPNIESVLNCTNQAVWNGYPIDTIFFNSWAPEEEESPYPMGDFGDWIKPQRLWKVSLSFQRFDPPAGGATRGWQLQPYSDGLWYVIVDSVNQVVRIPPTGDLTKIFLSN